MRVIFVGHAAFAGAADQLRVFAQGAGLGGQGTGRPCFPTALYLGCAELDVQLILHGIDGNDVAVLHQEECVAEQRQCAADAAVGL